LIASALLLKTAFFYYGMHEAKDPSDENIIGLFVVAVIWIVALVWFLRSHKRKD
jgi:hypothetical protein